MKILSIEDDPVQQKLLSVMFGRLNHDVDFADNGSDAFDLRIEKNYDLIFMDVHMPELDGLEATQKIRDERKAARQTERIAAKRAAAKAAAAAEGGDE